MNNYLKITALALSFTLVSCESDPFVVKVQNCPAVAIVSNTGTLTRFVGDERNDQDVAYNAVMSGVRSVCAQDEAVRFDVSFQIVVEKGPKFTGDSIDIPYFVVLMRDNNIITAKKIYQSTIKFAPGQVRSGTVEDIIQVFDNIDIARRYDYELLIGFQLTPEDVAFNALR